jgi:hypothetical protein
MRKLLVFLLVFVGGFAVLWFASRYRAEQREAVVPIPIERPPQDETQVPTEIPTDDETQPGDGVQVTMSGEGLFTQLDEETGRVKNIMRHDDSKQLADNRYELINVEIETFEPETGERRAILTAKRAIAVTLPGAGGMKVDPTVPVRFEDAVMVIEEEGRLAPLSVSMPWVDVWPEEERFESDAAVTVEGVGISANSLGIRVTDLGRRMTLPAKGDVRMTREDGERARLRAVDAGVIHVERIQGAGTDLLTVTATGGASFEWEGDLPIDVDAQRIELRAEVRDADEGQRYRILDSTAEGQVVLESNSTDEEGGATHTRFESDRARFAFDSLGGLRGAKLIGSPSGVLSSDASAQGGLTRTSLSGVGPLAVGFEGTEGVELDFDLDGLEPSLSFAMEGPGALGLEGIDVELTAGKRVTGVVDRDSRRGRAKLAGKVVATGVDGVFDGSELDLWFAEEADTGQSLVIAKSAEPAVIETRGDELDPWRIDTQGDIELHMRPERFDVPLASDVRIESKGKAPLTIEAGRLTDFLWRDRTFRADQGVTFVTPHGQGTAARVEALSKNSRVFSGTIDEPAEFYFRDRTGRGDGSLIARQVWVMPGVIQAESEVTLRMVAERGQHELDCDRAVLRSPLIVEDADPDATGQFDIDAYGVHRALLREPEGEAEIVCSRLVINGRVESAPEGGSKLVIDDYEALDGVTAELKGEQTMTVIGRNFRWSDVTGGVVEPEPGQRMVAKGRLPKSELPFELTADLVNFTRTSLHAVRPLIDFEAAEIQRPAGEEVKTGSVRQVTADHLVADADGALFSGAVHMTGLSDGDAPQPWTLDAGSVHMSFVNLLSGEKISTTNVREVVAWDGIRIESGPDQTAVADLLYLDYRRLRLEGSPAVFNLRGFEWESTGIEFDVVDVLLTTEQGTIRAADDTEMAGWTMRYESLRPFPREDDTILALRGAVCSNGVEQLRADWMLFWLDRDEWRRSAEGWLDVPIDSTGIRFDRERDENADPDGSIGDTNRRIRSERERAQEERETPNVFGALDAGAISHILREVYLEGDVQVFRKGEHASRFESIYVDLVDGNGWVEDAELTLKLKTRGRVERVSLKSELLRHSSDGSLHADAATVTTCMHAKPDYVIETGDLSLIPDKDPDVSWRVSVRKNSLRFQDTFNLRLPLPPIKNAAVDQRGRPVIQGISFGQSSRYGNFVSFGFSKEVGDTVSNGIASAMASDPSDVEGNYSLSARWLSSRGLLLRGGLELDVAEKFTSDFYIAGINDDSEDVGMVRVPTDERSAPRWSMTYRSRYLLTETEWVDFVVAKSSDVGFQSEFYENEFTSFEERQTYLHWRKAHNAQYYNAQLRYRTDDYRNEIEELPAVGAYQGLKPVGEVFGEPLLYRGDADLGYYRRRTGTGTVKSPFDPVFVDPYGQRESARFLTTQRLEVPVHISGSGVRFTPYTSVTGQAWSEGADPNESPARAALFAGAELSSEFHRVLPGNYLNTIVPAIGFRGDLADYEEGGDPIPFDSSEDPLTGNVIDLVLRSRFTRPQDKRRLDVGLKTAYAYETTKAEDDGWAPVSVLGEFYTEYRSIPVGLTYDMRYDWEYSTTTYSRTALGFEPWDPLALEFGYNRATDATFERLYEAASVAARWDVNWKWNLEGRQTISLQGDDNLYSEFILRRYGHDVFVELKWAVRQGEGSGFSFGIKPALGYRLNNLGLLDAWSDLGLR